MAIDTKEFIIPLLYARKQESKCQICVRQKAHKQPELHTMVDCKIFLGRSIDCPLMTTDYMFYIVCICYFIMSNIFYVKQACTLVAVRAINCIISTIWKRLVVLCLICHDECRGSSIETQMHDVFERHILICLPDES